MSFSKRFFYLAFVVMMGISIGFSACRTAEVSKEQIKVEKESDKEQKALEKEYQDAVKKHHKMQSDNTKEMMKQRKKQQKQANKGKERTFWDRLFRRECKTEFGNG